MVLEVELAGLGFEMGNIFEEGGVSKVDFVVH